MTPSECIDIVRTQGTARQTERVYMLATYGRHADMRALAAQVLAARPVLRVVA